MQSRHIHRLARKLRATYRKTKSLRKTSNICKVFTTDGRNNSGLVKRIAFDDYEPTAETIERLIRHGAIEIKPRKHHIIQHDLIDMTEVVLIKMLEERKPMPEPNYDPKVMKAFIKACRQGRQQPMGATA